MKKTEKIKKKIVQYLKSIFTKLKVLLLLQTYKLKIRLKVFISKVIQNSRQILRILLLLASLIASVIVYNYLSKSCVDGSSISNWLIAAGGMVGGIIAIVFSLISFLQQSVEDLQSSDFYDKYLQEGPSKYIFFALVLLSIELITSSLLVTTYISNSEWLKFLTSLNVLFIGVALVLIDYLYENASKKVNPTYAIDYIERESIGKLNKIKRESESLVKLLKQTSNTPEQEIRSIVYGQIQKRNLFEFSQLVTGLIEIARQLEVKNKNIATRKAIQSTNNILGKYLELRSGNSTISISQMALLAFESDSEDFLMGLLEEINRLAIFLLNNDDEPSAVKIIQMYESLIKISFNVKYTNGTPHHGNPISDQLIGYFKNLIEKAIELNNLEIIFQSSNAINNLMIVSTKYDNRLALPTLINALDKIMIWGYRNQQKIIIERGIKAYIYTANALLYVDNFKCDLQLDDALKGLFKHLVLTHRFNRYSNFDLILIQIFTYWLPDTIERAMQIYLADQSIDIYNLFKYFEEFTHNLRDYARNRDITDTSLLGSIGEFLTDFNALLHDMKENVKDDSTKAKISSYQREFAHIPPFFLNENPNVDTDHYSELISSTTFVGVKELTRENPDLDLVKSVVQAITNLLDEILKAKKSYGFSEPRMALYLVFVGILLYKHFSTSEILKDVSKYLQNFDKSYREKYKEEIGKISGLHELRVLSEIWQWRDELSSLLHRPLINDDLEEELVKSITKQDVDRFVFEVWGACDDQCSLKDEHEKIINKRKTA